MILWLLEAVSGLPPDDDLRKLAFMLTVVGCVFVGASVVLLSVLLASRFTDRSK